MARVVVREHAGFKMTRSGEESSGYLEGQLVTDGLQAADPLNLYPIKVVNTPGEASLSSWTHFVGIETDAPVRFAVRPKQATAMVPATADHAYVAAGPDNAKIVAVPPGGFIHFIDA